MQPTLVDQGQLGYDGRSGWYVSEAALPNGNPSVSFDSCGTTDAISRSSWESIDFLSSDYAKAIYLKSDEIPDEYLAACASTFSHDNYPESTTKYAREHGELSCEDKTWTPTPSRCCDRKRSLAGTCAGGEEKCIALLVWDPS